MDELYKDMNKLDGRSRLILGSIKRMLQEIQSSFAIQADLADIQTKVVRALAKD